ncbi:MAG: lipoprotein, partial [Plesiomonas sp.]
MKRQLLLIVPLLALAGCATHIGS